MKFIVVISVVLLITIVGVVHVYVKNISNTLKGQIVSLEESLMLDGVHTSNWRQLTGSLCTSTQRDEYDTMFNDVFTQPHSIEDSERFLFLHQMCSAVTYRNTVYNVSVRTEKIDGLLVLYDIYSQLPSWYRSSVSEKVEILNTVKESQVQLLGLLEKRDDLYNQVVELPDNIFNEDTLLNIAEEIALIEQEIIKVLEQKDNLYGTL